MSAIPQVKLEQFEGSLDLLLHLIKVNEINIFAIDLLFLANQYFAVLRLLEFRDLATAGDFLRTAATLVEIKSRRLLPSEQDSTSDDASADMSSDEDLEEHFKARIVGYHYMKEGASLLAQRYMHGYRYGNHEWDRLSGSMPGQQLPTRGDVLGLVVVYTQMLANIVQRHDEFPQAKVQKITLEAVIDSILPQLTKLKAFQDFYPQIDTRYLFAVYFFAILELAKMGQVSLSQDEHNATIWMLAKE
ncbi:MAG: segregation/condensation protein A [Pseudomonadota bacterium]|nr:segregation/condensation protein A [Pseudomonadota bacterium]